MKKNLDDSDRIISLSHSFHRLLRSRMGDFKKIGINPLQLHAMVIVMENDGLTMREFADHLLITSPSATSFIDRLVKLKWVSRKADPKNRKLVRLSTTALGRKSVESALKYQRTAMRSILSLLSSTDRKQFARILETLCDKLSTTTSIIPPISSSR
jgi:DNA-binding MarR family transcriptional regulator